MIELQGRQQMISDLLQEPYLLASLRASLKSIRDIERASGRLSQASGNARDLVALKTSLQQIPALKRELGKLIERTSFGTQRAGASRSSRASHLQEAICEMPVLAEKLAKALVDDPPLA